MTRNLRLFAFSLIACAAVPAFAGETTTVRCGPNQERVWVYDSLTSFDIAAKLKCGDTVELVGRIKGYVKVRTQEGTEGFIPDSSFSNLPPFEDEKDKQQSGPPQLASRRAAKSPSNSATGSGTAESKTSSLVSAANPTNVRTSSAIPGQASSAVAAPEVTPVRSASVLPAGALSTSSLPPKSAGAIGTVAPKPPAPTSAASKTTTSSSSNPHPVAVSSNLPNSPVKASSPTATATKTSASKSTNSMASPGPDARPTTPAATPALAAPKVAPATPSNSLPVETTANAPPVHETPAAHPGKATTESEDYPDFEPVSESADPACQLFFSAYGLSPAQFKWMTQNRKKRYPAICPAPNVSRVDFVIIFTHDVDIYSTTMPSPVHTDRNGFSDFSPMSMVDTAVLSGSAADKAHHEFVWVFKMTRGSFDPSRFSPRRRPQFSKNESNSLAAHGGSLKTVEDAFRFIGEQGPSR